uniref:GIY-YIG domain-containing protein n=1 Tax=viral metagenome TaxID=1070528 RepID=A0A6C0IRK5_9ZZZZ
MGYVYLITNKVNGMKYVGQSIQADIQSRWKSHRSKKRTVGKILYNAYQKYGFDNFDYKIICICFDEDTNKYEEEYIKKYNTVHPNGYNLLAGGNNKKHNEETKKQLSILFSGENNSCHGSKISYEKRKIISDRMKKYNLEIRLKKQKENHLQNNDKNIVHHKDERKEKISNTLTEYYKKCNEQGIKTCAKKIRQYDLDYNLIREYISISEAARSVNVYRTVISRACEKINGTAGGYRWKKDD